MGRQAKGVNDQLPPHEHVFGNTSHAHARTLTHCLCHTHTQPAHSSLPPEGSNKQNDHSTHARMHARQRAVTQLVFDGAMGARAAQTRMSGTARRRQQSSSTRLTVFPATPSLSCWTMGTFARAFAVQADGKVRLSVGVPRRPG